MDDDDMGDRGVGVERGGDFGAARRHVVALVDERVGAAEVVERLRDALAVGAVGEHQRLAVAGDERGEHRFDHEGAAALHRDAVEFAAVIAGHLDEASPHLGGHRAEIAVPGPPVAQHRLLDGARGGQRAGGEQERLAQRGRGKGLGGVTVSLGQRG